MSIRAVADAVGRDLAVDLPALRRQERAARRRRGRRVPRARRRDDERGAPTRPPARPAARLRPGLRPVRGRRIPSTTGWRRWTRARRPTSRSTRCCGRRRSSTSTRPWSSASRPASSPAATRCRSRCDLWAAAHGVASLMIAKPYLPWGDVDDVRRPGAVRGGGRARGGDADRRADRHLTAMTEWIAAPAPGVSGGAPTVADRAAPAAAPRELHDYRPAERDRAGGDAVPRARAAPSRCAAHRQRPVRAAVPDRGHTVRRCAPLAAGDAAARPGRAARARRAVDLRAVPAPVHRRAPARALADVEQVLVLGAGYDSRAYRFARRAGRPAGVRGRPAAAVAAQGGDRRRPPGPSSARGSIDRVEIDFRTQTLADRLAAAGFAAGAPTFVVWEGVVPVPRQRRGRRDARRAARAVRAGLGRSRMDLWDGTGGPGPLAPLRRLGARAIALIGEPVTFGVAHGGRLPASLLGDVTGCRRDRS